VAVTLLSINGINSLRSIYNSLSTMNTLIRLQRYSFAVRTYSNFYGGEFVPSKANKFY
jgi:hypothetical protein